MLKCRQLANTSAGASQALGRIKLLHSLHIQNYAVIETLALEFRPGLNLLSGETGSGKSILVDALGLALGGRASPDVVRAGSDKAVVTAVFRWEPGGAAPPSRRGSESAARDEPPPWRNWLEEHGLAADDDSEIILRREVQAGGKTRLLVNDQPVTLAAAKSLAQGLVELHGQNEHVALFAREAQLALLDRFAGSAPALARVGELFVRCRDLEREMAELNQNEQERLRAIDLLQFQVQELDGARLELGEDARLEAERQVLANLERIRAAAASAYHRLYEDEDAACAALAAVRRSLEELRRYDNRIEPYIEPLAAARASLEDLASFLRDYLGRLEAHPGRLEQIEDRLALIERLKRKYGKTIEEMMAYRERARQQLSALEHADERRAALQQALASACAEYREAAEALSRQRRAAARQLEKLVRAELAHLGMEKTRFEIHLSRKSASQEPSGHESCRRSSLPGGPQGIDEIELLIAPNPGEEMRPLERIASGGELSRFALALKTAVGVHASARGQAGMAQTFIFDEVDAGIGGRVAEAVGLRLKRLARQAQVLCVTHLPQIACFADHHLYVEKFERGGRTVTTVTPLIAKRERVEELARMLSGSQVTEAVRKHALVMLEHAAACD
jgi:DNA repair protein RecN (Recombination protein N)